MNQSDLELLEKLRKSAREDLRFLSEGGREERERWVVSEFLALQKMEFTEEELRSPHRYSKVDVVFRDARFQVKEILNPGSKRYRDIKARYERLMAANSLQDIEWPMFGYDVPPVTTIYKLITDEALSLSVEKKYATEKANLDLIFYVTRTRAALIQKDEIDREFLSSIGWRSISCLAGNQALVLFAAKKAPEFCVRSKVAANNAF